MRSVPILGLLLVLLIAGCASLPAAGNAPAAVPNSVANLIADQSEAACDCTAQSWATCYDPTCLNTAPPCGNYTPCRIPTGVPPPDPQPGPQCKGGYGRQCEDGKPPIANPAPSAGACSQMGTPCNLSAPQPGQKLQFAVIGDWGDVCCSPSCAGFVANMIQGWAQAYALDFIITLGDNFYPNGDANSLNQAMALYDWIDPKPIPGATPHFFPTLGNHDLYDGTCGSQYLAYFNEFKNGSSGNARYYKYSIPGGLVDLFSLNANCSEPDGNTVNGRQSLWLQKELAASTATWKIVFFHEPPFSTHGQDNGTCNPMNWPFANWGASVVLTGHIHAYERIYRNNLTYVINGIGGVKGVDYITPANGCSPISGSVVQYNGSSGAMVGIATKEALSFCLIVADRDHPDGLCADNFTITPSTLRASR